MKLQVKTKFKIYNNKEKKNNIMKMTNEILKKNLSKKQQMESS